MSPEMHDRPASPETAPDPPPCPFDAPHGLSDVAQLRRDQIMDAARRTGQGGQAHRRVA